MLALVDYFAEKTLDPSFTQRTVPDRWAVSNLTIDNLQSIVEACDSDASGFIPVDEINRFTSARPPDWSLLQWMSYWAAGTAISLKAISYGT